MQNNINLIYFNINDISIQIREATVDELEELREKGNFEIEFMICRTLLIVQKRTILNYVMI